MVFLSEELRQHLRSPAEELVFHRGDPDDPRLGELVLRSLEGLERRPDVVLLGIPQDIGVRRNRGRPGAAEAPEAIRRLFYRLTPDTGADVGLDQLTIVDLGDLVAEGKSLEELHALQQRCVAELLDQGLCVIVLGGGHDIAYPNGSALARRGPCGILSFDAHPDVRPYPDGAHSGSAFRQLLEELHFPAHRLAVIGLQPFAVARAHREYLLRHGTHVCTLPELRARGMAATLPELFARISETGHLPVYASFDLDALPAAIAPGVSAPSPTGIPAEELLWAAYFLGTQPSVCLLDIAEVNPRYDCDQRTARLAAWLLASFLSGLLQRAGACTSEKR